jgi:hypothetical protein
MIPVSVTLTTCGRLDLLKDTIDSFISTNSYPIDEFTIICDDPSSNEAVFREYGKDFTVIGNVQNIGQKKSLDILFTNAKNEYIFHLEDDWYFDNNTPYIENSIQILENNPDIHQVWLRHEHDNPHKTIGSDIPYKDFTYKYVDPNFRDCWCGYSWNPGLRRKSDYVKMFPNGINKHYDELACSRHVKKFDYKVVLLNPSVCYHIGYGRSTQ